MADPGELLQPCWFCGGGTTTLRENGRVWMGNKYGEPSSVSVIHHCTPTPGQPSRPIERVGRDRPSAIAAWNTRIHAQPQPIYAPLTGAVHELKIDAPVFSEIVAGRKLFELRKNDRGYQCGDLLRLRETRCTASEMDAGAPLIYTGQETTRRVVSILRGPRYGLPEDAVIMSIVAMQPPAPTPDKGCI